MTTLSLDVHVREVLGKKVKYLRQEGVLPATVYGKAFSPVSVQLDERAFAAVYQKVGRTALVNLHIPGHVPQSVFIQDVQRHPVSRAILHADFRVVDLTIAMTSEIPIVLFGSSLLVDRGDAILNQSLNMVEIRALPADLPQHLEIDVSGLGGMDDALYVRDIPTNERYVIVTSADELIVSFTPLRARAGDEGDAAEEGSASSDSEPVLIRKDRDDE